MDVSLVLTVIGEDKPGLVEALSETIAAHSGNWLESRLAHLAGKFIGVLRVSVPHERLDDLKRALDELRSRGLEVRAEKSEGSEGPFRLVRLELVGSDRPGIVRDISTVLAGAGINVEELTSECSNAPMSGQMMFKASARLQLPANVTIDEIRGRLEEVAHDLMVDINLDEIPRAD